VKLRITAVVFSFLLSIHVQENTRFSNPDPETLNTEVSESPGKGKQALKVTAEGRHTHVGPAQQDELQ
jgi:hypothetical protein